MLWSSENKDFPVIGQAGHTYKNMTRLYACNGFPSALNGLFSIHGNEAVTCNTNTACLEVKWSFHCLQFAQFWPTMYMIQNVCL